MCLVASFARQEAHLFLGRRHRPDHQKVADAEGEHLLVPGALGPQIGQRLRGHAVWAIAAIRSNSSSERRSMRAFVSRCPQSLLRAEAFRYRCLPRDGVAAFRSNSPVTQGTAAAFTRWWSWRNEAQTGDARCARHTSVPPEPAAGRPHPTSSWKDRLVVRCRRQSKLLRRTHDRLVGHGGFAPSVGLTTPSL